MLLAGAGQIGMAIVRRAGYGMKIIVGDKNIGNAEAIVGILNNAGFDAVPTDVDLSSLKSVKAFIAKGQEYGPIIKMVKRRRGVAESGTDRDNSES